MCGGQQPSHVLTNLTGIGQERSEGIGPSTTQVTRNLVRLYPFIQLYMYNNLLISHLQVQAKLVKANSLDMHQIIYHLMDKMGVKKWTH